VSDKVNSGAGLRAGKKALQEVKDELGPFVVAADKTRMPILFTNAKSPDNDIVYTNQSFLDLAGYESSDAIGLPFHRLLAETDRVHATLEVIAGKHRGKIDLPCLRKDNTEFDASVLVSPVCDKNGKLQQYFICFIDLTQRVENRIEQRLREVEIFVHTPGFIAFSTGPNHRFTFANMAYEILVGRQNLVGRRVADVLPEIADQGFIEFLDEVYRTGERKVGKNIPIRLVRGPSGEAETRYIDYVYEPVRDASGAVVGLFCEGSDVTNIQAVSEKLNDIQSQLMHVGRTNAMGTMAATLAHELNQPLAAVANYASGCINILKQSGLHSEDLHKGLSAIAAASDRAGKIIRGLRDMTKRITPVNEVFDLSNALKESVHLVRVGGCKDVSISTQCEPSMFVSGNKIQVQQVIMNLLRNACDAAAQRDTAGEVVALTTQKNGSQCIVIRDNGLGLPENIKDNVFSWVESIKSDGMGIGLSICRTIAEGHGGAVTLDSTGPSGTSFTFSLPNIATDKYHAGIS